jgi:hypothetical protein
MENINSTMILSRHSNKNNRVAIDVFLPAGSAGKKVCVRLRTSAVKKIVKDLLIETGSRFKFH